ncbi:MAG: hypothetical protein ACRYGP_30475 [Janthinobacterium lividum]
MDPTNQSKRRSFTDAARAAAAAARQAKKLLPKTDGFEVFAVRAACDEKMFLWEIRKFGGLVADRGDQLFPTAPKALEAGQSRIADFRLTL